MRRWYFVESVNLVKNARQSLKTAPLGRLPLVMAHIVVRETITTWDK
jgi:hypothetical protein